MPSQPHQKLLHRPESWKEGEREGVRVQLGSTKDVEIT